VTDEVGMVIFLGSWAIMFAALFFSLGIVRTRMAVWPPLGFDALPILMPGINTLVLLASSITLHFGSKAFFRGDISEYRKMLLATIGLGIVFIALQFVVWLELWNSGIQLSSGLYPAFFYVLTMFHALHVFAGLALLGWLVPQVKTVAGSPKRAARVKVTTMFWHFVDVVWVLMFILVYVL
jgi:cytochrome c oxidase subunit 3